MSLIDDENDILSHYSELNNSNKILVQKIIKVLSEHPLDTGLNDEQPVVRERPSQSNR